MDNIITGAFGVAIFLAFTGGLAQSIGELPFILIVVAVGIMLCIDFYESAREGLKVAKKKPSDPTARG
jgi:4-hydroxybenzoate polyprenyltransferase